MKKKIEKIFNDYMAWIPSREIRILVLLIPIFLLAFIGFKLDNDFWFLINTGKHILNNGFYTFEPFSIHANLHFIPQQWLTSILFYIIYDKFSITGMFVLVSIVNILIIYLIYKICLTVSENKVKLSLFVTLLVGFLLVILVTKVTRPQIFDATFLLLELYLLELYGKEGNYKYLIGLPIISLFMINLHASIWIMTFIFMLPYLVSCIKIKYFERGNYRFKPLIITMILMFLISFLNPYGVDAMLYIFNSYGIPYLDDLIIEMRPLTINDNFIIYFFVFFVFLSYYFNRKNKVKIRYVLLFLGTLFMALKNVRSSLFLLIASALSLSYNFKYLFEKEKISYNFSIGSKIIAYLVIVILASVYLVSFDVKEDRHAMRETVNYFEKNVPKDAKIYADYNNGGYLQWYGYKTYIDARAEVYVKANNKKEDIMNEYAKLQLRETNYKYFLDKYKFDYLVVASYDILYNDLNIDPYGYETVYNYGVNGYSKGVNIAIYRRKI